MDGRSRSFSRRRRPPGSQAEEPDPAAGQGRGCLMARTAHLRRLWQIQRVVRKYGLTELLGESGRRVGLGPSAATRALPLGVRIREALEELGPVFVKFGQTLSTRRDL